ncbi:hypothetical protein BCR35DRAFT_308248 [Leucosporidium creatinivorum]|uniref:Uncharacterized protein n=1 Tax=Leucosporidium creatinivorum TaxID=106004 RepID=A0A1Y2E916_9BASI|nr:hypothetical protein BCR35DRAFT_308248 [Leucosporidium creatinivorum]
MPPLAALTRLASASHSSPSYSPLPSLPRWLASAPNSPILSRTTKEGRPRLRRGWVLVAFPALALLLLLLNSWSGNEEVQVKQGPKEQLQDVTDACKTVEVLEGRKEASFWVAQLSASHLRIRPRSPTLAALNCPTLSQAHFTPRLHFSSLERRLLLPSPSPSKAGTYLFPLLPPITAQPTPEVTVEVILDSGWFPGGEEGLPCGENEKECDYEEMSSRGYRWTEEEVLDAEGRRPSYRNREFGARLFPSLPRTDLASPPLPNLSPTPETRHWIRLLGDSNLRTLLHPFASSLGIPISTNCLAHQGSNDAHPTTLLCWNDSLLLSFNWWFGNQGSKDGAHEGDAEKLKSLLSWSARDLLESVPWEKDGAGDWPSGFEDFEEGPEAIFLSIGSHMPAETSLGMSSLLSALEPILVPSSPSLPAPPLILALTSATSPSRLPPKYQPSRVMRNDLMIRATNEVVRRWAGVWGVRTLDLFSMSRTAGKEMMKDPVHFWDPMYQTWTHLFFHAWQHLIPTSQFLPSSSSASPSSPSSPSFSSSDNDDEPAGDDEPTWEVVRLPSPTESEGLGVVDPLEMEKQRLAFELAEAEREGRED